MRITNALRFHQSSQVDFAVWTDCRTFFFASTWLAFEFGWFAFQFWLTSTFFTFTSFIGDHCEDHRQNFVVNIAVFQFRDDVFDSLVSVTANT
ncbi:hypothetical protein D3C85_1722650 [compost metagenome]